MGMIVNYSHVREVSHFDEQIIEAFINAQEKRYEKGEIARDSYTFRLTAALQLKEFHETGQIKLGSTRRKTDITPHYSEVLSGIMSYIEWTPKYRSGIRKYAMPYFKWLAVNKIETIDSVDEKVIRAYLMDVAKRLKRNSVHHINLGLKIIHRYLFESSLTKSSFANVFAFNLPREEKVKKPFTHEEIYSTLMVIDRDTVMGKRDYAMILLGTVTGLRSVDIRMLTFDEIDWITGEIRLSQQKTGKALALPLTHDIGKAIEDYILHGRPQSDSPYIFLKMFAPYREMTTSQLYNIQNKYRFQLGLPRGGFHNLRRTLGSSLVIAGTPITTVAQVLGQRGIESTKQYVPLDSKHLKEVALDLAGLMPEKGVPYNG